MEEVAEVEHFSPLGNAVVETHGFVLGKVNVVASIVFQGVADVEPGVGKGDAVGKQVFQALLDGGLGFEQTAIIRKISF